MGVWYQGYSGVPCQEENYQAIVGGADGGYCRNRKACVTGNMKIVNNVLPILSSQNRIDAWDGILAGVPGMTVSGMVGVYLGEGEQGSDMNHI